MSAVEVDGLTVTLTDGSRIVDDASFRLERCEVLGIVGESGSGKSTLSLAMLGFARDGARIAAGRVAIDGTDVLSLDGRALREARRSLVSYVPQDPATALNPALPVGRQLAEMLASDGRTRTRVAEVLEAVDLPADDAFLRRRPRELSGGQQQRIALGMAVIVRPRLVVLDEPTTGLDVSTQARVLAMVEELCEQQEMSAIYVSHDLAVVDDIADRVAVMYGGQLVEAGPCESVIGRPSHPYTRALLDAVPSTRERLVLRPIPGRAPGVRDTHPGCVFAARCTYAVDECTSAPPPWVELGADSAVRCVRAGDVRAGGLTTVRERATLPEPEGAAEPDLEVSDLTASYGAKQVLFDVSLGVRAGECLAVVGESGSGKTTMSRSLIGMHERDGGHVRLGGNVLAPAAADRSQEERRLMQYVFQNPYGSLNPRRTVGESIAMPLRHFFGERGAAARTAVADALDRVELAHETTQMYPAELSGGQRQRSAIARALVCRPSVLICDEVTSALDVSVQAAVVELLRALLADGLGMILVTHNLAVVRSIAHSLVVLSEGTVVERGETGEVLDVPAHPYTQGLLADSLDVPEVRRVG